MVLTIATKVRFREDRGEGTERSGKDKGDNQRRKETAEEKL